MRYKFIEAEKANYPICILCSVLMVSRSGYYIWRVRPVSERKKENNKIMVEIKTIYNRSRGTYGSPRVCDTLQEQGHRIGRHRVAHLMRTNGIIACYKKRFIITTDSEHLYSVAPNIIGRDFDAMEPNRVWVSDITYVRTYEGWLYLAAIMDLYSRKIVGWAMADNLQCSLIQNALDMALTNRSIKPGLIHHSDRGLQYASDGYQLELARMGIRSSMSRKGDCWDNAPMESFFKTLKVECVYRNRYHTRKEAQMSIFDYIEVFYNRQRKHSYLNYKTPEEFENQKSINKTVH